MPPSVSNDPTVDSGRVRIKQIFEYLRALDQLKNPAPVRISEQRWVYWLKELPRHPCIVLPDYDPEAENPLLLRVARPKLSKAPLFRTISTAGSKWVGTSSIPQSKR
jgi:hypothetical protein